MTGDHSPVVGESPDPDGPLTPEEQAAVDRQGAYMDWERETSEKRGKAREPTMTINTPGYAGGMYHELPGLGGAMFTHPDDG